MEIFLKGFLLSLSLIVAIGAQNAFIIKQGVTRNYVFVVSGICFICDVILMGLGIFGVGEFLAKNKVLNLHRICWDFICCVLWLYFFKIRIFSRLHFTTLNL
ncbi:LysE/ArgO family amino acid transporter [Helicobacter bilis]|uniref:LysE/ArgO family amino acid transporter n=1 Tax=Helicobacter bilis TaxID=37372 RepID=UPI0020C434D3|nr:LysE family transporter [Helicobacter bilis]